MAADKLHPNDEDAFKKIFELYKNRVFGYVLAITHSSHIAEELTQELFIKLWLSPELLRHVEKIEHYIFTMARNRTLNYLRHAAHDTQIMKELQNRMQKESPNAEDRLVESQYNNLLKQAVEQLSLQRRLVYQMSRDRGMSLDEIAAELTLSRNTVKNHLVEALRLIREFLANHGISILLLFFMCA